jgi:hypothetical protein
LGFDGLCIARSSLYFGEFPRHIHSLKVAFSSTRWSLPTLREGKTAKGAKEKTDTETRKQFSYESVVKSPLTVAKRYDGQILYNGSASGGTTDD